MYALRNSSLLKLMIGIVVVALLTGCVYNGVLGAVFTFLPAEEVAGVIMESTMYGQTQQVQDYYTLLQIYGDVPEKDWPLWEQNDKAEYEAALNPETHGYYYYVLNPSTGMHQFSVTQAEHNAWIDQFYSG